MADERIVVTSRGICRVPEGDNGIPIEEVYPRDTLPRSLQGSKFYETPQGYVLGKPLEGANDQGPKPVRFPSRESQIARGDAEFWARLEGEYDKVKITAQPMRFFGDFRSDVEEPGIAADEVRVRLMHHFPDGPGMAAIAQKAANRYAKALQKWLEKEGERRPKPSELARRWGMFCHDHGNAEREYYQAGYRPALVDPYAIDFSEVKLTGRERKAAWRDRSAGRERDDDDRER
jgi:hypothetical protein